jgi:hypothetical protein
MPFHDWTRVIPDIYQSFHGSWITHLSASLNGGSLPDPYYSLSEQRTSASELAPLAAKEDAAFYLAKRRTLVIRHATGNRIVALVEIVSPANKHNRSAVEDFVEKVLAALRDGIHVLVIDPFPPGRHDPQGSHGILWEELGEPHYEPPADLPLSLVSYCAKSPITAYIEPTRVGLPLTEMPLFLTKTHYVRTPLEATYMQSWAGVPQRWQRVIEA